MSEPVVILTANFGAFDDPRPQADQDIDVEWRYYADGSYLGFPAPWKVYPWLGSGNDRLDAKWFKCEPPVESRYAIWIDASMEVTSPRFAREAIAKTERSGIAVFAHPRRNCIYDEYAASIGGESQGGKYDRAELAAQIEHYESEGWPRNAGLYACGVVAYDLARPGIMELGAAWYEECHTWSIQDQLSFPVVCARRGILPATFGFSQIERHYTNRAPAGALANRWLRIWPHNR